MKKLFLSLSLIPLLAHTQAEEKTEFIKVSYNQKTGFWQSLVSNRPAEQDMRSKFHLPSFLPSIGGKKLEINWSQLGNATAAICIACGLYASKNHIPKQDHVKALISKPDCLRQAEFAKRAFPFQVLGGIACLYSSYKYLNGEQKWPFRIIDAEESI